MVSVSGRFVGSWVFICEEIQSVTGSEPQLLIENQNAISTNRSVLSRLYFKLNGYLLPIRLTQTT